MTSSILFFFALAVAVTCAQEELAGDDIAVPAVTASPPASKCGPDPDVTAFFAAGFLRQMGDGYQPSTKEGQYEPPYIESPLLPW